MPLIRDFGLTDVTLSTDGAEAGQFGVSSPAGLLVHRYVHDLSTQIPQSVNTYTMFDPGAAVLPIVFFGAFFRWDLDDVEADNTEVGIWGSGSPNNILAAGPIDQTSNNLLMGVDPTDPGLTSTIIDVLGVPAHPHFARALSTTTGMPIILGVDTSAAGSDPYSGKIMAYLLFASLA